MSECKNCLVDDKELLAKEIDRLKARNEKLDRVLTSAKAYTNNIKPPLGHDRNRLFLILIADIALADCEAGG